MSSESARWYTTAGKSFNEIEGKNGMRAVTLRDARKLGLLPSVTSILAVENSPGLNAYREKQIIEAAWANREMESYEDFSRLTRSMAKEHSQQAAERGSVIHGYLEAYFGNRTWPAEGDPYVEGVRDLLMDECGAQEWSTEREFASTSYGGCADLYSEEYLIDFKTKDFSPSDKEPKGYDNHVMQLAAYRKGLGLDDVKCANVFVSRDCPGHATIYWWKDEELQRGYSMFLDLLDFWYDKRSPW